MIDTLEHRSGVQFQTDAVVDVHSDGIEVTRDGNPNNRGVTPTGSLAVFPAGDVEFYTLNGVKYQLEVVPRHLQWVAVAPKMGKRLGGFLSQPELILGIDSNCSGGREKGQGCVKECLKVEKLRKTINFRGLRIESAETSHRRRGRRSHMPNFWSRRPSRQWEFPVPESHWPSEKSDPKGQPPENVEEPDYQPIP